MIARADLIDRVQKVFGDLNAVHSDDEDYPYALSVCTEDFLAELERAGLEIVKK